MFALAASKLSKKARAPMVKAFLDFVTSNNICCKEDKVLIAVSGGVDSVVLVKLFKEAGFDFAIAHCNFQLRGSESDGDEQFVRDLALINDVQCFVHSFDTKNYADIKGVSTQMAARDLRYDWFARLRVEYGASYIATAHHLDDSLETVIFNLAKGTGISGLRGILPKKDNLIRPLLFASKQDILDYAKDCSLEWREDASNESIKYSRNLIRHKVVPVLKKLNPSLISTFKQTQLRLSATEEVLKSQVEELKKRLERKGQDIYISKKAVNKFNIVVLEEFVKPYGFNFQQVQEIWAARNGMTGKFFLSDNYQLNIDREHFIVSPVAGEIKERLIHEDDSEVENEVVKLQCYISDDPVLLLRQKHEVSLDFDRLKFPLKLRKWKEGDSFCPLGMKGKKKLSDFMIDEKIPLNLKERVCVIESEGELVWIVGFRADDRFKVRSDTKRIYNMVMSQND